MKRLMFMFALVNVLTASAYAQSNYASPATGEMPLGTYSATDIDSVSLTNGNLHLNIPVYSLPGRELPLQLNMDYNSQFLESRTVYNEFGQPVTVWEFLGWRKNSPVGGRLTAYRIRVLRSEYNAPYTLAWDVYFWWVDGLGGRHLFLVRLTQTCSNPVTSDSDPCENANPSDSILYNFRHVTSRASDFLALDTGDYFSNPNNPTLPATVTFKNGNKLRFYANNEFRTLNGNYLHGTIPTQTFTPYGVGLDDRVPEWDTVGRFHAFGNGVTFYDSNGQQKTYTLISGDVPARDPANTTNITIRVIREIRLPNGRSYLFDYNSGGLLDKVTLPSGAYIRYQYGTADKWRWVTARIISSDGTAGSEKTTTYAYDATTTTVTGPSGDITVHEFSGGLDTITRFKNAASTELKRVERVWQTGDNARITTLRTVIDTSVSETIFQYDAHNNVTRQDDYDFGNGARGTRLRYITRTYKGGTYWGYDIYDRLESECVYDNADNVIAKTEYEYDNYTILPLVDRTGTIPQWINPSAWNNIRGNVTAVKNWLNTSNTWLETRRQYDVLGNIVKIVDPEGHATETSFTDRFTDNVSRNSFAYPTRMSDPAGFYVDSTYDFNTGLVRQTTDMIGTTSTTYDLMNRETQTTFPNSGWTRYTYCDVAGGSCDVTPKITKEVLVDSVGNVGRVITTFDKLYHVIRTETADPGGNIFVESQYDAKGRKWKVSNPYRSGETVLWTVHQYDGTDRPTLTIATDGSTVQYSYSGNQTTVTDEGGNQRLYTYDGLGRMTKVEEPYPTLATPLVTAYIYNPAGKLTQTSQGSQTRTFVFDSLGRMTSQTLPESGTTTFAYNNDSLITSKTDARNVVTSYAYNSWGWSPHKLTTRSYSDGTPGVLFDYDSAGRRTWMQDALGEVTYTYATNTGRIETEYRFLTGIGAFTTRYVYNIKGDMTQMTYPSGRIVNFNYATGGGCCNSRLSSVVDQTTGTTIANNIGHNAAGETTSRTLGNGVVESFSYNVRLQLTTITALRGVDTLMNVSYSYGTNSQNTGRVLFRTDALQPEHSVSYTYDSLYRLSQAAAVHNDWNVAWTFDQWGNRLTQTPQGLATSKVGTQMFGYLNNRLTSNTYDAAGNQTNDGLHNYTFNAENQITQMDGGTATYGYDGEGRRMKKTVGSETTYSFYGPQGLLCEFTTTNTGATQASSTDRTIYRTSERTGTAVLLINSSGMVVENNRTLPYGESWLPEVASANNNKFTTYERDQESGLDYAMNRYDSNSNGRFMSPDQGPMNLVQPQSLNRYTYGMNDPINHVDKTGNEWVFLGYTPVPSVPFPICGLVWGFRGVQWSCQLVSVLVWVPVIAWREPEPQQPECEPGWITENMTDPDGREFTAEDLNLAGRAVYAEAGGSTQGGTYEERLAVGSVIFNRIGTRIPGGSSGTVAGVVSAPAQFASVTGTVLDRLKFANSNPNVAGTLRPGDCENLRASLNAVRDLVSGDRERYSYTAFRAARSYTGGERIGGTVFGDYYTTVFRRR